MTKAEEAQAWSDPLGYLQDASGSLVSIESIAEVWAVIIEEATVTETHAEEAQRLVDEGQVRNPVVSEYRTTGLVWDGYDCYHPSIYPNGDYWCECAWARYHAHPDDLCAHALAVKLAIADEALRQKEESNVDR